MTPLPVTYCPMCDERVYVGWTADETLVLLETEPKVDSEFVVGDRIGIMTAVHYRNPRLLGHPGKTSGYDRHLCAEAKGAAAI